MYNWYVINTYSGHEKKVEANLLQRFKSAPEDVRYAFREVIVPTEQVTETDGPQVVDGHVVTSRPSIRA